MTLSSLTHGEFDSSSAPIDTATRELLGIMREIVTRPLTEMTAEETKALGRHLTELYGAGPDIHHVQDHELVAADGGNFRIRVFRPARPRATIVYLPGGGWRLGPLAQFDTFARLLAFQANATVVLVDYRKTPEHRFPAAVEDACTALGWAHRHVEHELGGATPLVVAGDSAGGNLAAVAVRRARDSGCPPVALHVLAYPVLSAEMDRPSYRDPDNELTLTRASMAWFWDEYLPDVGARSSSDASPLLEHDLSGLPPAVVLTPGHDVLLDEALAYLQRLTAAGVPVRHHHFPDQAHGFLTQVALLPASAVGLDAIAAAVDDVVEGRFR